MGSQQFYPDEGPVHTEHLDVFAIEQHPVTNAQFSDFVADTGYLTVAERPLEPAREGTGVDRRGYDDSSDGIIAFCKSPRKTSSAGALMCMYKT